MATPLEKAREAAGLTQNDVARRLGMSQGHYSRIERSGATSRETALRIAAMFPGLEAALILFPDSAPTEQVA